MQERIIEIIVLVISELRQKKSFGDVDIEILQKLGYTKAEISTAFSWLVDRVEFPDKFTQIDYSTDNMSFRVLHDVEKELFTTEAWGELIQLNTLGIVTNEHIEQLIEKTIMSGIIQIDSSHLKRFVANILFHAHVNDSMGSRIMLTGNDSIN